MNKKRLLTVMGGSLRSIYKICPAISPTLGSELLTNGNMETGDPPSSWTPNATPTLSSVADERTGGAGSKSINIVRGTNDNTAFQAVTLANYDWCQLSAWVKNVDSSVGVRVQTGSAEIVLPYNVTTSWVNNIATGTVNSGFHSIRLTVGTDGGGRVDDVVYKKITFSSMFSSLLGNLASKNGTFTCKPTIVQESTQTGIVFDYKDDANFLLAVVSKTPTPSAILYKCIAGVLTSARSGSITYGDGNELKVIVNGNTCQLFYNSLQVGADVTIDMTNMGKRVYGFNTYAGNTVGLVATNF